jgi:hypothetical protein
LSDSHFSAVVVVHSNGARRNRCHRAGQHAPVASQPLNSVRTDFDGTCTRKDCLQRKMIAVAVQLGLKRRPTRGAMGPEAQKADRKNRSQRRHSSRFRRSPPLARVPARRSRKLGSLWRGELFVRPPRDSPLVRLWRRMSYAERAASKATRPESSLRSVDPVVCDRKTRASVDSVTDR